MMPWRQRCGLLCLRHRARRDASRIPSRRIGCRHDGARHAFEAAIEKGAHMGIARF
jgi:hypothetical protein